MKFTNSSVGERTPFVRRVISVVSKIPRGETLSYQEVARRAGRPRAFRAVGNILNRWNYRVTGIPCHRVVRRDGASGGYVDGAGRKRRLLAGEKL